ncbi:hypothetical protein PTTG_30437, partial [Puccinia triticina 1-1 BBBD Race 1]
DVPGTFHLPPLILLSKFSGHQLQKIKLPANAAACGSTLDYAKTDVSDHRAKLLFQRPKTDRLLERGSYGRFPASTVLLCLV